MPVYDGGQPIGVVCVEHAERAGLTVLDLAEDWAPRIFDGDAASGPAPYRERFARIAREDFENTPAWDRERRDRYFELYGISPSFATMGKRLADDERHACHAALTNDGLRALAEPVDTWRSRDRQRADRLQARQLKQRLEGEAITHSLAFDDLATHRSLAPIYGAYRRLTVRDQAVREMQNHLRCERLLGENADPGIVDDATIEAMFGYFRKHMVVSWQLDREVRDALITDSRELDHRQTLRALRERVIDATGIIEDGSAVGRPGLVLGKTIDTGVFAKAMGATPLANGAEDLLARATDEAARALGWTDPGQTARRISAGLPAKVAVRLSPAPDYHSKHMELVAVIDRGDVLYDPPNARPRAGAELARREKFPSLVLYAQHQDRQIPLVRWPTTIGGWQPESIPGRRVMLAYKESPPGARVWRDLIAEPRWIPPDSTPERDLMRPRADGTWTPRVDTFGPSYASAYGLAMLIHHGDTGGTLSDNGIRTHGSVSYASILEGYSHGCHRLHNHRALRLGGFLLDHRKHQVRGQMTLGYVRRFFWRGRSAKVEFESRGFRYELDPPVVVEVLDGDRIGTAKRPLPPTGLSRHLRSRYGADN